MSHDLSLQQAGGMGEGCGRDAGRMREGCGKALDLSLQSADRNGLPPAMAAGRPPRTRVAVRISGQSCISAHGGDFKSKST